MSEGVGEDMTVQEQEKKLLFHLCIVDLGTITEFLDKLNRTLKAQS